jgi:hypothetical protein
MASSVVSTTDHKTRFFILLPLVDGILTFQLGIVVETAATLVAEPTRLDLLEHRARLVLLQFPFEESQNSLQAIHGGIKL